MGFSVKMLIVAPVFVSQSQINCLRKSWHKEGRAHSMEISNGHNHTRRHAHTHERRHTQMGCRVAAVCVRKKADAIRVHFSCLGLLPYLERSRPILATVTGALGRLGGADGGLRGAFWKPEQVADSAICSWEPSLNAA